MIFFVSTNLTNLNSTILDTPHHSLKYRKTSSRNEQVAFDKIMKNFGLNSFRENNGMTLISGTKAVGRALEIDRLIQTVYFTGFEALKVCTFKFLFFMNCKVSK